MTDYTDKDLADALVADGILEKRGGCYALPRRRLAIGYGHEADKVVRDWRVAGACLERCSRIRADVSGDQWVAWVNWQAEAQVDDSLPRAIIEAYVRANDE